MKRALLIAAAVMFMAGSASAILPQIGYIGIFSDATRNGNSVCPAQYGQFEAWIWALPSVHGMQAAEFAVSFPATTVVLASVKPPDITLELGWLAGGISVAFGEGMCQTDWVWLYHLTMMQLAPPTLPANIQIIPHPGTLPVPAYQFATCELGYPIEPCIYLTPLYLCMEPPALGVEQSSWGAIKSMF